MEKLITISEEELDDISELTYRALKWKLGLNGFVDENTDIILTLNKEYGEILISNIKEIAKKRSESECTSTLS